MSLSSRWKRQSHFRRHVIVNLLLGLAIDGLIHRFHHTPIVQRAENAGLDAVIAFFGARGSDGDAEQGIAYTVLDVDDATWAGWGSPNLTPRKNLVTLLDAATAAGAAAILVDLDLTRKEGENGLSAGAGDRALDSFLTNYRGRVPIVLPRLLRAPPDMDSIRHWPAPLPAWFERETPFVGPIYWGTVQFVEEIDGVVRRWRLWEPVCSGGRPGVLPSVQLLAATLVDTGASIGALRAELDALAPAACDSAWLRHGEVRAFGHVIEPSEEEIPERIIYSLRWPPDSGPTRMVRLADGSTVPVLLRIPAGLASDTSQPIDARLLAGRVVVVGASDADSRDWYATPMGRMPGMMLIVNSIESLRRYGQYGKSPGVLRWLVVGGLLILTSVAYARYHPMVATLLITPLIYLAVLPLSFYVFTSGAWLDFTAPVLGVQLHELIASAEDAWKNRGRRFPEHE